LHETYVAGRDVWAWRRGRDDRLPCFLSEREAVSWMANRLRAIAVFERQREPRQNGQSVRIARPKASAS
jgi:hypothetical protein